jgi:hypothetical protein
MMAGILFRLESQIIQVFQRKKNKGPTQDSQKFLRLPIPEKD